MKILICSANFAPELTGIGKYSGELAQWLSQQGHEVRVVAAPPYYPAWRVADGYRGRPFLQERIGEVPVWRAPLWVPAQAGGFQRIVHLLSFGFSAAPLMLWWAWRWRPQVCLVVAPFLTAAPATWLAARLVGARCWLHVQDYEIDVAFNLGLMRGGVLRRAVLAVERGLLRRFDRVSSISQRMLGRAADKGVAHDRLRLLRNWADIDVIAPLQHASTYRAQLALPAAARVLLFAGTLGRKQGLAIIPALARRLESHADLHFVVCGDGPMKAELVDASRGLPRVHFLPLQPLERLGELLGLADIHLLPQDPAAEDLVLPSKLSGMLASGRPVLATCAAGTEIARAVEGRGVVVPPGDEAAAAQAILALLADDEMRRRFGEAARAFAVESLGRDGVLARFAEDLQRLVDA